MRRRKPIVLAVGVLLVLTAIEIRRECDAPRATQGSFALVRKGMTLSEVESILGPPGDYTTGPTMGLYPPIWAVCF